MTPHSLQGGNTRIVDPHSSLDFLKGFLVSRSQNDQRQIVIMSHYPLDSGKHVSSADKAAFFELISEQISDKKLSCTQPVVLLHGHMHDPPEAEKPWTCPNKPIPYYDVQSFDVGTPFFRNPKNHLKQDGSTIRGVDFTIIRLGNHYLEAVGVATDVTNPSSWTYTYQTRLGILHSP